MNITMVLFGFFPSDVRVRKEALTLATNGHRMAVLCCAEEDSTEIFHSIEIPRVGQPSDWKGRMTPKQLLKFWLLCFIYLLKRRNFDVLHCHDLTSLPPAVWYKIIFPRTKIVYDCHEFYPDAISEKLGKHIGFPFFLLEKLCLNFVSKIIGISIPMREIMKKKYGIRDFLFIPNFPTKTEFFIGEKRSDEKLIVIYAGGIHRNRGYEELVEAVEILSKKRVDFVVLLLGGGPLYHTIEKMVWERNLRNFIELLGPVHFTKVRNYLINADIGIALYKKTKNSRYGLSNKIFEYICCGLPLIYPFFEGSILYLRTVGAVNVDPSSPTDIARQIELLLSDSGLRNSIRNRELALAPQVTWESIEGKLLSLYG